jgi:hypothetical protein
MKRLFSIALFFGIALSVFAADEVEFRAKAPSQVIEGKPFQLTYTVNQRGKDFQAPDFENFDHLAGPYTSTSSSISIVNGHHTSSYTVTYTFTLMGNTAGTYTIPPASIRIGSDTYSSNGVRITVLPPDEQPSSTGSTATSGSTRQSSSSAQASAGSGDIFIRTIASKTKVHEQEALLLSYKLYFANVNVAQFTNNTKLPDFTGFLKQELEQGEIQTELEHYNGRNYQTATLYRTLLYPQHSGDIKIAPATFEAVLQVQTRSQVRSIFDDFFGSYTNVTKALTAPGMTIHVSALPSGKPAGFSGAVGTFTLTPSISTTELKANEAVTLKLEIQGAGNMKLIKTPAVDWPEGFELYDPKVTNNFRTTVNGVSGTKSIEYLAIPRAAGEYTIPAVTFCYFDTHDDAYKTLRTPEYTLHVARGANDTGSDASQPQQYAGTQKEDIKQLGSDIRYIHTEPISIKKSTKSAFLSNASSLTIASAYLLPLFIAICLFIGFRKRIRENADIRLVRYKKANKVAQRRLKAAQKLLKQNNQSAFYEEIERAALSYLSDRLSIPMADLNKENIASILRQKGVSDARIAEVTNVLSTAEFARYAPSTDHAMNDLYTATTNMINNLENEKI